MPKRRNWAQRLVDRLNAHPLLVLVFFSAALVSSVIVLAGGGIWLYGRYDDRYRWRDGEYRKLASLKAGFTLSKFEEELGSPLFKRTASSTYTKPFGKPSARRLVESSFRGRGYWVQTISDNSGTVIAYAVTSCANDFRPTFVGPARSFRVVLNRSTFEDIVPWRLAGTTTQHFPSGATANSFFIEFYSGGNPTNYKSFAWGLNDACPDWYILYDSLVRKLIPLRETVWWEFNGPTKKGGAVMRRFRQNVRVNTYAETAPAAFWFDLEKSPLHVGVDRILVRTLSDPEPVPSR